MNGRGLRERSGDDEDDEGSGMPAFDARSRRRGSTAWRGGEGDGEGGTTPAASVTLAFPMPPPKGELVRFNPPSRALDTGVALLVEVGVL